MGCIRIDSSIQKPTIPPSDQAALRARGVFKQLRKINRERERDPTLVLELLRPAQFGDFRAGTRPVHLFRLRFSEFVTEEPPDGAGSQASKSGPPS